MHSHLAVPENYRIRNKVRGPKRRLRSFSSRLDSILDTISGERLARNKVMRYELPSPTRLVDSTNSSHKLRKSFMKLLVDHLLKLDSTLKGKYRTLLSVSLPFLSRSRIDVCVDEKYFEKLINNTEWTPLQPARDIIREMGFALPGEYKARGYLGASEEPKSTEEHWFIWKDR